MKPDAVSAALDYARKVFAEDFSGHDFFHTERVYRLAGAIQEREGGHRETVLLAALLHDVDDPKLSPETAAGHDRAVAFLREQGASDAEVSRIVRIIEQVSFRGEDSVTPDSIEGRIVQDADRLDAIGAIGIGRTFAFGGSRGQPMHDPDLLPRAHLSAADYASHRSSTVNHFYEKLLLLKDLMGTQTGRRMAEHRHQVMEAFLEEFFAEWNGTR
ncbi:MAG: HD domain-containing protein [Clostridia bacterium]|nr:HD domain-containing protein [Clostridia bacterium]